MGQQQGKDGDNNNNDISPRKDKKDRKKKEKKIKPLKDQLAFKMLVGAAGASIQVGNAIEKVGSAFDPDNWKKKPVKVHDGHFELTEKRKSSVNTETSLGILYCLPNELLAHLSSFLSWKEALPLQASSRGLFLLLQEDLFWKGLYDGVEWKLPLPDPKEPPMSPERNSISIPTAVAPPPQPEECCYKKKFLKRYLGRDEKKARTTAQINELYDRIRKLKTTQDEKTAVHDREYNKQKKAMDNRRLTVAFICCIIAALFLKPVTIFIFKLVLFTFQLPAELFISFIERFSCWRSLPVTCWGFNSRKTFDSFEMVVDAGVRDDYLLCMPTVSMKCTILYIFWALFQIGKLIASLLALTVFCKVFLGFVERFSANLLQFKAFSQEDMKDRYTRKVTEIKEYYEPKIAKLHKQIDTLKDRDEMRPPRSASSNNQWCCIQ